MAAITVRDALFLLIQIVLVILFVCFIELQFPEAQTSHDRCKGANGRHHHKRSDGRDRVPDRFLASAASERDASDDGGGGGGGADATSPQAANDNLRYFSKNSCIQTTAHRQPAAAERSGPKVGTDRGVGGSQLRSAPLRKGDSSAGGGNGGKPHDPIGSRCKAVHTVQCASEPERRLLVIYLLLSPDDDPDATGRASQNDWDNMEHFVHHGLVPDGTSTELYTGVDYVLGRSAPTSQPQQHSVIETECSAARNVKLMTLPQRHCPLCWAGMILADLRVTHRSRRYRDVVIVTSSVKGPFSSPGSAYWVDRLGMAGKAVSSNTMYADSGAEQQRGGGHHNSHGRGRNGNNNNNNKDSLPTAVMVHPDHPSSLFVMVPIPALGPLRRFFDGTCIHPRGRATCTPKSESLLADALFDAGVPIYSLAQNHTFEKRKDFALLEEKWWAVHGDEVRRRAAANAAARQKQGSANQRADAAAAEDEEDDGQPQQQQASSSSDGGGQSAAASGSSGGDAFGGGRGGGAAAINDGDSSSLPGKDDPCLVMFGTRRAAHGLPTTGGGTGGGGGGGKQHQMGLMRSSSLLASGVEMPAGVDMSDRALRYVLLTGTLPLMADRSEGGGSGGSGLRINARKECS